MEVFRGGKDLATEVAVGGRPDPSEPDNVMEKHPLAVIDDSSLERVPSQSVQDGVKKIEAVTLTWTQNQLILAYFRLVRTHCLL
jgi:hypothetical protein